ncbi:hypothetical protein oki169_32540 [Helicobacter pylori]|nr:Uncharacterised protein [Campylobacter jejuni subsp. doylei]VTX81096.1 Uncharacterised protein [Campylobacter jejuni]
MAKNKNQNENTTQTNQNSERISRAEFLRRRIEGMIILMSLKILN